MMFQLTLIFYHITQACLQKCFTLTGHLKSPKNECLWSSVEKTAEAFTCCRKKYLYSSKNRSNLYMICSHSVKKFWVIICALCIGMRSQMLYTNGHLKSTKCECLWSSAEHTAEAVTCRRKNIFILKEKSSNLYIIYVLCQWKRFWVCIYAHCSSMRSQMLYTNRRFEIWQVRMFVKQRRAKILQVFLSNLRSWRRATTGVCEFDSGFTDANAE